ncbi:MAG: hypothetical protein K0V04_06035, partial [Deltaproteobacteria bacterium]|nr:hypothetical protein [Deltaproteobacteria bacterium]
MDRKPKPRLSEVLAALVSSVARARSVADSEALRIACMYQQHELLRGLPAPRLRLTRVTVGLPVMIAGLVERRPAERATMASLLAAMETAVSEDIARTSEHHRRGAPDDDTDDRAGWEAMSRAFEQQAGLPSYLREFEQTYRKQLSELDGAYGDPGVPEALVRSAASDASGDALEQVIGRVLSRDSEQGQRDGAADERVQGIINSRSVVRLVQHGRSAAWSAALMTPAEDADLQVDV